MPEFRLKVPIDVRFRDTDAMGHINNAVYLSYLEVARQHYLKQALGVAPYTRCELILARTEIDFRSPGFEGEDLEVAIRVARLGTSSFDFAYEIRSRADQRLIVEARSVQVMFDYSVREKRPLSAAEKVAMRTFEGRNDL